MVEELSPDALAAKLEDGADVQVVDTRAASAYREGHIPGAVNVPFGDFADAVADVDWQDDVVFVCQEGISSRQAGRLLESYAGVDDDATVASLTGGYDEWDGDLETGED